MKADHGRVEWATCPDCGKRLYGRRADAKAAQRLLPDRKGMREYPCPTRDGWHIGHMPKVVRKGFLSRDCIYNPGEAS